jgi:hypothetical protein
MYSAISFVFGSNPSVLEPDEVLEVVNETKQIRTHPDGLQPPSHRQQRTTRHAENRQDEHAKSDRQTAAKGARTNTNGGRHDYLFNYKERKISRDARERE